MPVDAVPQVPLPEVERLRHGLSRRTDHRQTSSSKRVVDVDFRVRVERYEVAVQLLALGDEEAGLSGLDPFREEWGGQTDAPRVGVVEGWDMDRDIHDLPGED